MKHVPQEILTGKFELTWINHVIKKLIRRKSNSIRKPKRQIINKYRDIQNSCKKKITEVYDQHITGLLEDVENGRPSKKFWRSLRPIIETPWEYHFQQMRRKT